MEQKRKLLKPELEAERRKLRLQRAELDQAMQDKADAENYTTELEMRQQQQQQQRFDVG